MKKIALSAAAAGAQLVAAACNLAAWPLAALARVVQRGADALTVKAKEE